MTMMAHMGQNGHHLRQLLENKLKLLAVAIDHSQRVQIRGAGLKKKTAQIPFRKYEFKDLRTSCNNNVMEK